MRTGARITEVQADRIIFADEDSLETQTVIATTGQIASVPAGLEAAAHGAGARIAVCDDLRIAAFPDIYAAGDTALAQIDDSGRHAPMSCQHAMPMGRFAGYNAAHDLLGLTTLPYRQERYVTCLDLGRSGTVFTRGWDRTVDMTGDEAASLKRAINTQWIYPPQGSREDIIAASDIAHAIRR